MPQSIEPTSPTAEEVRRLCGDMLDWKVSAILALRPSAEDLAAAVAWAERQDDIGQEGHPLEGLPAQVYELLTADDDDGAER